MTAQPPLELAPADSVPVGDAAALAEDVGGGQVFLYGQLAYAWDRGDDVGRRFAAVQLVRIGAARAVVVAAAFGVDRDTLHRWAVAAATGGVVGLISAKRGPKGPSRLTGDVVADILARRAGGASLRVIAAAVGLSTGSVRRALALGGDHTGTPGAGEVPVASDPVLEVLAAPAARTVERVAARFGQLTFAPPVFTPAARVPLAGLLLAVPALEATGLLTCANDVYTQLPAGFYGLDTMLVEGVWRALAGEPRAEGATRIDPVALGRVLGLDRAPEVKTIRRKIAQLAATGRAGDLLAAMAHHHLSTNDADGTDNDGETTGLVLYVDGHVRAYQGTRKIAKTHVARLKFPAPATVETWVADSRGDPVLVVMSELGASLASELVRLLPELRAAVGDRRRVLVGFDRGGWSPALFEHMSAAGFDVLTWRKGPTDDVPVGLFTEATFTDDTGRTSSWVVADTTVDLPIDDQAGVFRMRQITRLDTKKPVDRQIHILTTRTDLSAGELVHRMGARWRHENYFRYARMHLDLDSHDTYQASDDDPERSVPNPAKKFAHQVVLAAAARLDRVQAHTDAAMLDARSPAPGSTVMMTNADYNAMTADLYTAQTDLNDTRAVHRGIPTRLPLREVNPGQQVLETETKLLTHAIRMTAFNTVTALARDIRINTNYARANHEAYALARQVLTHPGDLDPHSDGTLTVRLDPMPTNRATAAIAELCEHLTATGPTYPGTTLTLRYEIKTRP